MIKLYNEAIGGVELTMKVSEGDLKDQIETLANAHDAKGCSLEIDTFLSNKTVVNPKTKFSAADLVVCDEVLKNMTAGNDDALDSVPEKVARVNFFFNHA